MSTTITIKLNKDATQFQAGESTGFGLRGGVQYYDRETKAKEWTNYEAVIFAKNPNVVQFYQDVLRAGSVIELTGTKQKIKQFQGNNGLSLSIELLEASIGLVHTPENQAPQQQQNNQQQPPRQQAPQQQSYQQQPAQQQAPQGNYQQAAPQQAPQQQAGYVDDQEIPFNQAV